MGEQSCKRTFSRSATFNRDIYHAGDIELYPIHSVSQPVQCKYCRKFQQCGLQHTVITQIQKTRQNVISIDCYQRRVHYSHSQMGTFVDPAFVEYQLQITDCVKHSSDPDFRWRTSSDYQLRIVANRRFAIRAPFVSSATFQHLMKWCSGLSTHSQLRGCWFNYRQWQQRALYENCYNMKQGK